MDYAYHYGAPERLYLNVTNRCSNRCAFCVRQRTNGLGEANLRGGSEPNLDDLLEAVAAEGGPEAFREIVWCGFGEPTYRLDLIVHASPHFRAAGCRVRLNTNGHGCLIQGRDVLPDLAAAVDAISVSLNAPDVRRYISLCQPVERRPEDAWEAMLDCLRRAPGLIASVQASVVGSVLAAAEIRACERLASELGATSFRVR